MAVGLSSVNIFHEHSRLRNRGALSLFKQSSITLLSLLPSINSPLCFIHLLFRPLCIYFLNVHTWTVINET